MILLLLKTLKLTKKKNNLKVFVFGWWHWNKKVKFTKICLQWWCISDLWDIMTNIIVLIFHAVIVITKLMALPLKVLYWTGLSSPRQLHADSNMVSWVKFYCDEWPDYFPKILILYIDIREIIIIESEYFGTQYNSFSDFNYRILFLYSFYAY